MRLARYIGRRVVGAFVGVLAAALVLVLGIEFADRAHQYTGEGWASAAALLYACKAAVMGYQLAPAALLIAVEIAIASLKRHGEVTAMRSLGLSPWVIIGPCLVVGLGLAGTLFVANETFVGKAGRTADDITVKRFLIWGDWSTWYGKRRWFRAGKTIYFMRDVDPDGSYRNASVFEMTDEFRLKRRLDASRLTPEPDGRWHVVDGSLRTFQAQGQVEFETLANNDLAMDEPSRSFGVHSGRPDELQLGELRREIEERREVGLRDTPYVLALHAKATHPLLAVPFAIAGAALSLRPRKRDAAAVAMIEGLAAVALAWGGTVVMRAVSLSGRIAPWLGPWCLLAVIAGAAGVLARRTFAR